MTEHLIITKNKKIMNEVKKLPELGFSEALKLAYGKLTQFSGRSRRSEFWWCMLAIIIAYIVMSFIPFIGGLACIALCLAAIPITFRRLHDTGRSGWWYGVYLIGTFIGYGVMIGCLINALGSDMIMELAKGEIDDPMTISNALIISSANLLPIAIAYLVGIVYNIMMIVFLCFDSQPYANKYGESPKYISVDSTPTEN